MFKQNFEWSRKGLEDVIMPSNQQLFLYIERKKEKSVEHLPGKKSYILTPKKCSIQDSEVVLWESHIWIKSWVQTLVLVWNIKKKRKKESERYPTAKRATPAPPKAFLAYRLWCLEK
jgi:hypothetical protein